MTLQTLKLINKENLFNLNKMLSETTILLFLHTNLKVSILLKKFKSKVSKKTQ